jgi:hypothetical protein
VACGGTDAPPPVGDIGLLQVEDLPEGFTQSVDLPPSQHPVAPRPAPPACVQRPPDTTDVVVARTRVFRRDQAVVVETATEYPTVERARRALEDGPVPGCPSVTARADGVPDVVAAAPSPFDPPHIGDGSAGYVAGTGFEAAIAVRFRAGRIVVEVVSVRANDDPASVAALARKARKRLSGD